MDAENTSTFTAGIAADCAYQCAGDGMAPLIQAGDYVLIRQQHEIPEGHIAAIRYKGETMLAYLYEMPEGYEVVSGNHAPPFRATGEEVEIIGLAVAYQRVL